MSSSYHHKNWTRRTLVAGPTDDGAPAPVTHTGTGPAAGCRSHPSDAKQAARNRASFYRAFIARPQPTMPVRT